MSLRQIPLLLACCAGLAASPDAFAEPPLLAEWLCNEGSGPQVLDSSGNGNHGTLSGATFVPQGSGHAISLDGRDDYVNCGPGGAGGIGINGAVTLEAWVKPMKKAYGEAAVLGQDLGSYLLTYYNTEICIFYIRSGSNRVQGQQKLYEWNHIVAAFDGTNLNMWVNGRSTGSNPSQYSTLNPTFGDFVMGTEGQLHLPRFKGELDNVRVWDGALTEAEAVAHFQNEAVEHDYDPTCFTNVKATPYYYLDGPDPEVVVEVDYRLLQPLPFGPALEVTLADSNAPNTILVSRVRAPPPDIGVVDITLPCAGLPASDYLIRVVLDYSSGAYPTEEFSFSYPPPAPTVPSPAQNTVGSLPPPQSNTVFGTVVNPGGGFTVNVNGTDYPFSSRISWPNGSFNVLNAGAPDTGGEGSWSPNVVPVAADRFVVTALGAHYSISREIEIYPSHVLIKDAFSNTSGSDVGFLVYNETPVTAGLLTQSLLSGHERFGRQVELPFPDYGPSVFFADGNTGMGIVPLDDVFVVQGFPYTEWQNAAGIGTETFALAPGDTYTLEWVVYPTGTEDYYDFINAFRTAEGRIGTIGKTPGFITDTPHVPGRREIPTVDHVEKRALDIGLMHSMSEIADDPEIHIEGIEFIDFPQEMALLTQQRTDTLALHPDLQVAFHIAHSLYATDNPGQYSDSRVILSGGSQATWSDGSAFGPVKQAAGWRWWVFYPFPGNTFHTAMLDSVDTMMDDMGYDGGFFDGFFAAYAGERTYDTGLRWDGRSAEVNLGSKTINRKFSSVLLLSRQSLIDYARKIRDKGGVVVANNSVMMRSFVEEDYIIFDNEGASGPELHLAPNMTALSVSSGFDSEREIYLDILDKLRWGELFIHYTDTMDLTHISLATMQYPMTFEEIRSGMVRGPGRAVTMNPGIYGWHGSGDLHFVSKFDARGAPAPHDYLTTIDTGADPVRTELNFSQDESAVVVPIPVSLTPSGSANARVLQYDESRLDLLLNGQGSATMVVRDGTLPVIGGDAYDVTIGGVVSTIPADTNDTLTVSPALLTLTGQVAVIIEPNQVTLDVVSSPVTGMLITGTAEGPANYSASVENNSEITLTAPALAADSGSDTRFGFVATQSNTGGGSTDILNPDGSLAANLPTWGKCMYFDDDGSLFIGDGTASGGKYPIWRYPYEGDATWGNPEMWCEVDAQPRALTLDSESGALYIGLPDFAPWLSNVLRCPGQGQSATLFCGVNDNSRQIQDLAVGPDGKVWMGLFAWGYLRFPLSGGFTNELRITNGGQAGGMEFGPDRNGDGKPELYGSVDNSVNNFGYYDYESGLQLGTLFTDPWIGNYCMCFWPDRNNDGVADICIADFADRIRVYDGVTGASLGQMAGGSPIFYAAGGVPREFQFVRWRINGVDQPDGQRTATFTIQANTTAEAVYVKPTGTYLKLSQL